MASHRTIVMVTILAFRLTIISSEEPSCDAEPQEQGIRHVPRQPGRHADSSPLRYSRALECGGNHLEILQSRIPLHLLDAPTDDHGSATVHIADAPLFNPDWSNAVPSCFRAVIDGFLSASESATLLELVNSNADLTSGASYKYHMRNLASSESPLLAPVIARAKAVLAEHFEVEDELLMEPYIIARVEEPATEGQAPYVAAEERRAALLGRSFNLTEAQASMDQVHAHVDSAYLPDVGYTFLVYLSPDEMVGGETLIVDGVSEDGVVVEGLLVEPARSRAFIYTAGVENVHTGLGSLSGRRSLIQLWFPHSYGVSMDEEWYRSR